MTESETLETGVTGRTASNGKGAIGCDRSAVMDDWMSARGDESPWRDSTRALGQWNTLDGTARRAHQHRDKRSGGVVRIEQSRASWTEEVASARDQVVDWRTDKLLPVTSEE